MPNPTERTPAEELREAAKLLRDVAEQATPVHGQPSGWMGFSEKGGDLGRALIFGGPGVDGYRTGVVFEFKDLVDCEECVRPTEADVEWMSLVDPGLAEPLAVWLENAADLIDKTPHLRRLHSGEPCRDNIACIFVTRALAVARVLNGDAS